jgi:hypothetical protein
VTKQAIIHKKIQPNLAIDQYESRKFKEDSYIFGYLLEIVEIWQLEIFFLKSGKLGPFFHKNLCVCQDHICRFKKIAKLCPEKYCV